MSAGSKHSYLMLVVAVLGTASKEFLQNAPQLPFQESVVLELKLGEIS